MDQAISELSGTQAPSRPFLTAMLPIFTLVVLGFGIGVWKAAQQSRALRVTGGILVAQGIMFPLWLLFPMTSREEMVEATTPANDVGHSFSARWRSCSSSRKWASAPPLSASDSACSRSRWP